jgi:Alternative complex III, ActD subunit
MSLAPLTLQWNDHLDSEQ